MKILYMTTKGADYLQDSLLYGLRKKLGENLVDWPRKNIMYKGENKSNYGNGFTLWNTLDDIAVDREDTIKKLEDGYYDYLVFSSIYREQLLLAHLVNYKGVKYFKTKFVFVDGEDNGFPTVYDAIKYGTYFKRENPNKYDVKILGISIPKEKMLDKMPDKKKPFTRHVQCMEAYRIYNVARDCTTKVSFTNEADYYQDLSDSCFGITMKKSGWDTPRHIENAGHYVVNCIYAYSEWDGEWWSEKPKNTHPLGLKDMENCIIWKTPEDLVRKIRMLDKTYEKVAIASRKWANTKTCEYMADEFLKNI